MPSLMSIAREFAHAEVAFVLAATAPDHDVRLRFFNARKEAPFVGHATIAAHAVLLALGRRGYAPVRQHSGTGIIEVRAHESRQAAGAETLFEFRQTMPELDNPLPFKTTLRVAEALRLPATQLHEVMPARIARKGSTRLLVPIGDARALDALAPNFETLVSIGSGTRRRGIFRLCGRIAGRDRGGRIIDRIAHVLSRARYSGGSGQRQRALPCSHPICSSWANSANSRRASSGTRAAKCSGPGRVGVRLEMDQGSLIAAHIGGNAIIVSEGTLAL